jgi:hypothetical protein
MKKRPGFLAPIALTVLFAAPGAARADGFAPGEETVFTISYLNLPTGEGRIVVGRPEGEIWPLIFQARTGGVAALVDIREHLVSYWHVADRLPSGSDLKAYEVGDYHVDSARFDRENLTATVRVQRKGKLKEKSFPVPADVQDLTGAFMWLRLQPLEPGQRHAIPVVAGTKQFTVVAEVLGREEVETPAGRYRAFKVKVRTQFDGRFSTKRDSYLWLADDPRRFLVKASADFAVGSLVAELKSYRAGSEVAAR